MVPVAADCSGENSPEAESPIRSDAIDKEEGDSGIDANSQGSCSSNDVKSKEKRKDKKKKKNKNDKDCSVNLDSSCRQHSSKQRDLDASNEVVGAKERLSSGSDRRSRESETLSATVHNNQLNVDAACKSNRNTCSGDRKLKTHLVYEATRPHPAEREDFESTGNDCYTPQKGRRSYMNSAL